MRRTSQSIFRPSTLLRAAAVAVAGSLLGSGLVGTAQAQTDGQTQTLAGFAASDEHRARVYDHVDRIADRMRLWPACTQMRVTQSRSIVPIGPIMIQDGKLASGSWRQTVEILGCGDPRYLNFVSRYDGQTIVLDNLPNGNTIADGSLYAGAKGMLDAALANKDLSCADSMVVDTESMVFGVQGNAQKVAMENWTVKGCGNVVRAVVQFISTENGTRISVPPEGIHLQDHERPAPRGYGRVDRNFHHPGNPSPP